MGNHSRQTCLHHSGRKKKRRIILVILFVFLLFLIWLCCVIFLLFFFLEICWLLSWSISQGFFLFSCSSSSSSYFLLKPMRVKMAQDIARGLYYLHSLKPPILHRDIKYVFFLSFFFSTFRMD